MRSNDIGTPASITLGALMLLLPAGAARAQEGGLDPQQMADEAMRYSQDAMRRAEEAGAPVGEARRRLEEVRRQMGRAGAQARGGPSGAASREYQRQMQQMMQGLQGRAGEGAAEDAREAAREQFRSMMQGGGAPGAFPGGGNSGGSSGGFPGTSFPGIGDGSGGSPGASGAPGGFPSLSQSMDPVLKMLREKGQDVSQAEANLDRMRPHLDRLSQLQQQVMQAAMRGVRPDESAIQELQGLQGKIEPDSEQLSREMERLMRNVAPQAGRR